MSNCKKEDCDFFIPVSCEEKESFTWLMKTLEKITKNEKSVNRQKAMASICFIKDTVVGYQKIHNKLHELEDELINLKVINEIAAGIHTSDRTMN